MVTWSEENRGNKRPWTINFTITPLRKTSFLKRQGSLSRKKLNKTKKKENSYERQYGPHPSQRWFPKPNFIISSNFTTRSPNLGVFNVQVTCVWSPNEPAISLNPPNLAMKFANLHRLSIIKAVVSISSISATWTKIWIVAWIHMSQFFTTTLPICHRLNSFDQWQSTTPKRSMYSRWTR